MKPKYRSYLAKILGILLGLLILFFSYEIVRSELNLRKYEKAFFHVQHPPGTVLVDAFSLEINYYPATYVDDSTRFKSTYAVGNLRSYTGDWHEIQNFYHGKLLETDDPGTLPIVVLPLEIQNDGQKTYLRFANHFSYSPFDYDMLEELQQYYQSKGMSQTKGTLYLVYVTPDR